MEQPDAGICRTCLSPKAQLIEMQQAVPNLELMTYHDILDFCTNIHDPKGKSGKSSTKYPLHICLRCSKALEVSYHFLKMVRNTDAVLQGQQKTGDELKSEEEVEHDVRKKDTPALGKVGVVIDNKELLLQEQKLVMKQKPQKDKTTAVVSGVPKYHIMEDSQTLEPFTNNESPSKVLWPNSVIKSGLNSIAEFEDLDWMDCVSFGINDNYRNDEEEEKNTEKIKSAEAIAAHEEDFFATVTQQDQYFTDSDFVNCVGKAEVFNTIEKIDNLPNNVLATQTNVPYENLLTKDFLNKNSITKAIENVKSLANITLNDFVDDLKENAISDDSEIKSEESSYSNDYDELLKKTTPIFVCGLCNKTFTDVKEYTKHVNRHKDIIPVRCKHCSFNSCYPESLRKHYEKIHCVEPTNSMLQGPNNPNKTPKEQKYYAKTYQCAKCNKESHSRRDIRLHLLTKHHVFNNADFLIQMAYNCPECSRSFKQQRSMRLHFISTHGKRKDEPPAPGETFQCLTCAKVYPHKHSLRTHQRICVGPTNIYCNLCNKNHDSVRQFEKHLSNEHAVEMIHECEICGKTFKNAIYLSVHRKRHMERNFLCQLCPKKYAHKSDLQVHIDRIHNMETKALCGACGATFISLTHLRAHETKEHNKKLHICSQCNYKTTTITRLKLHQYSHVGMPYRCTMCDKGFAFRIFMRRHAQTEHQITLSDVDLAEMFRQNMGYPSRYDVFSNAEYTLNIPEVIEEDIERELSEFGLNFEDIMRDLFDEKSFNYNA